MPFAELLDMELAEVGDGRAVGRMPMTEVVRSGEALAVVRVEVYDVADAHVATAHGTYKTDGPDGETAWDGHTRGDGDAGEE
jgi:acyl-coenzyme A thioesterase PaaI-like protein